MARATSLCSLQKQIFIPSRSASEILTPISSLSQCFFRVLRDLYGALICFKLATFDFYFHSLRVEYPY